MHWKEIKRLFTKDYMKEIGSGEKHTASRVKQGEAAIWQQRFGEHTIDSEEDLESHLDYTHDNLVKHGYGECAVDWQWSSFHRYVKEDIYDPNWSGEDGGRIQRLNCK